ncbi:MAG TPA: type II toxin-antitoxin system CcdA family antitoxin [Nocardioides sp.]|nr:type II toxin-antitoxin system CcdA family antitoxin [Nocardioides sp.]
MARLNVYVPDDLAARAREAGLNVSRLTQDAIATALGAAATDAWLAALEERGPLGDVPHDQVLQALDESRDESGDFVDG